MTTTAHEDQFTVGTQTIEKTVRQPYDTVAILRRNIAALEVALKQQTERAEAAEAELAKLAQQSPIKYLYRVIDCFGHDVLRDDPKGATILETVPLFAAPAPAPAEWRRVIDAALGLLESTTCETGVCMCGDSVIGHADFSVGHSACDSGTYHQLGVIEQLRALLQSAEVQAGDKWQLTPAPTHPADRNVGEVRHD